MGVKGACRASASNGAGHTQARALRDLAQDSLSAVLLPQSLQAAACRNVVRGLAAAIRGWPRHASGICASSVQTRSDVGDTPHALAALTCACAQCSHSCILGPLLQDNAAAGGVAGPLDHMCRPTGGTPRCVCGKAAGTSRPSAESAGLSQAWVWRAEGGPRTSMRQRSSRQPPIGTPCLHGPPPAVAGIDGAGLGKHGLPSPRAARLRGMSACALADPGGLAPGSRPRPVASPSAPSLQTRRGRSLLSLRRWVLRRSALPGGPCRACVCLWVGGVGDGAAAILFQVPACNGEPWLVAVSRNGECALPTGGRVAVGLV